MLSGRATPSWAIRNLTHRAKLTIQKNKFQFVKTKALLDYVFEHAVGDVRPYRTVEIMGLC